jgi:ribosomal-protein-alanine N-acetyltransferase
LVRPTEQELNIRLMGLNDVPQVFDIERNSFNDSSWSIDAFYHEVEQNEFAHYFVSICFINGNCGNLCLIYN